MVQRPLPSTHITLHTWLMLTGQLLQQLDQRHQVGDQDLDLDLSSLNIPWHWFLNTRALWSVSDIQLATQQQPVSMLQVLELVPEMIGQCGMGGEGDTVRWMDSRGGHCHSGAAVPGMLYYSPNLL